MLFRSAENASVAVMLAAGPDLSEDLVHRASNWTVLKSGVTTVAMVAVLVLLLWRGFAWWQSR